MFLGMASLRLPTPRPTVSPHSAETATFLHRSWGEFDYANCLLFRLRAVHVRLAAPTQSSNSGRHAVRGHGGGGFRSARSVFRRFASRSKHPYSGRCAGGVVALVSL